MKVMYLGVFRVFFGLVFVWWFGFFFLLCNRSFKIQVFLKFPPQGKPQAGEQPATGCCSVTGDFMHRINYTEIRDYEAFQSTLKVSSR